MKLYATTTSERASKGQGGNEYLNIDLFVGSAKESMPIGTISLISKDINTFELLWQSRAKPTTQEIIETIELKGKSQKGEEDKYSCSCNEGGKTENHIFWSKQDYRERGNPVCPYCDDDMYLI